ncbi:hypothetical protein HK097_002776, partial [Rhizophlyctis rosea]
LSHEAEDIADLEEDTPDLHLPLPTAAPILITIHYTQTLYHLRIPATTTARETISILLHRLHSPRSDVETLTDTDTDTLRSGETPTTADAVIEGDEYVVGSPVVEDVESYRLCRLDRNTPGVRTWIGLEDKLSMYGTMMGDEFLLHHTPQPLRTTITIPPSTTRHTLEYCFGVLVRDAIERIKILHDLPKTAGGEEGREDRWGLYHPRWGTWLDEGNMVVGYDVEGATLEMRALSFQFILRIFIPDSDQRFALKVLPNMRTSDVLVMVIHQLAQRKIILSDPHGQYSLYMPDRNIWMEETKLLEQYDMIHKENIHYKCRYTLIPILFPTCTPTVTTTTSHTPPSEQWHAYNGPQYQKLTLWVDPSSKVDDLLNLLAVNYDQGDDENMGLFGPSGEAIVDGEEGLAGVVKDLGEEVGL